MKGQRLDFKTILKRSIVIAFNLVLIVVVYSMVTASSFTEFNGQNITGTYQSSNFVSTGCSSGFFSNTTNTSTAGYAYSNDKFDMYESEDEFIYNNIEAELITNFTTTPFPRGYIYVASNSKEQEYTRFRDARSDDGWSTWNHPEFTITYKPSNKFVVEDVEYTSPPTHLQLCLNSLDENPSNKIPSKTWIVSSVADVSNADGWTQEEKDVYLDNTYTFEKIKKLYVNLGSNKSEDEEDFFGDKSGAYGTYTVEVDNNSQFSPKTRVKMSFAGTGGTDAEVVSTDWNEIVLRIQQKRKNGTTAVADVTIKPN